MKKVLTTVIGSVVASVVLVFSFSATTFAAPPVAAASCGDDTDSKFLSFPTWHRGLTRTLDPDTGSCSIDIQGGDPSVIVFTIALNIIDIVLRLIGIIAVGFVIWGGFQYIVARGEPERAKSGLITIRNALVGMVIAMVAAFVVSFVVAKLKVKGP